MHIRSLREERENFNEDEFFAIERIDRKYDRMKKEDDNDDDREYSFDYKVMKKHEQFSNT
jgi:hypothetical protein